MVKFRAWNERKGCMVYGPRDDEVNASWVLAMCEANNIEPMQFTGLHDKNGIEIYVGDIVSIPREGNHAIIFDEGCFGFKGSISNIVWRRDIEMATYEVIGNRHTTPELLEGDNA